MLKTIGSRANLVRNEYEKFYTYYFGRYGGDEFYLYYEAHEESMIVEFAEVFFNALCAEPYVKNDVIIPIRLSAGALYSKGGSSDFMKWMEQADHLLYGMKNNGKGQLKLMRMDQFINN